MIKLKNILREIEIDPGGIKVLIVTYYKKTDKYEINPSKLDNPVKQTKLLVDKYLDDVQKDVYVTWLGEDDESESAEESDGEEEDDFEEDSSDDEVTHLDLSDALDFWADQWLKRGGQTVTLDEAVEALSVFLDEHGYETTIKKIALGSFFKRHGYHRGRKRVDGKMVTHVFLPKLKKGS